MITRFVYKLFGGAFLMVFLATGALFGQVTSAAAATTGASYVPVVPTTCGFVTVQFENNRGNIVTRQVYTCNGTPNMRFYNFGRRYMFGPNYLFRGYFPNRYMYNPYMYNPYMYTAPTYSNPAPSYSNPAPSYTAPVATTTQPAFSGSNATAGTTMSVFTTGTPPIVLCSAVVGQDGNWRCVSTLAYPTGAAVVAYAAVQPDQAQVPTGDYCAKQASGFYSCVLTPQQ